MPERHDSNNLGAMRRSLDAWAVLLRLLGTDERVQGAFMGWCLARDLTPDRFRRLQGGADDPTFDDAVRQGSTDAIAALERFVTDELQLPFTHQLPALLLDTFTLWAHNLKRGEPLRTLTFEPDADARRTLPVGRGPRRTLERDVAWYYRARVKQPPDPLTMLVAEYVRDDPATTRIDPHSVVSDAIARVHRWLDGFVVVRQPGIETRH